MAIIASVRMNMETVPGGSPSQSWAFRGPLEFNIFSLCPDTGARPKMEIYSRIGPLAVKPFPFPSLPELTLLFLCEIISVADSCACDRQLRQTRTDSHNSPNSEANQDSSDRARLAPVAGPEQWPIRPVAAVKLEAPSSR